MPDRASMLSDLGQILSQPGKLTCSYFATGGYAATFLNMGLVCAICLILVPELERFTRAKEEWKALKAAK